ncbi:MAG: hypothetical protein H0X30_20020 [Anaerolineae bacterium]|nr:hypothetical protein [Anaerolineae bacterium]
MGDIACHKLPTIAAQNQCKYSSDMHKLHSGGSSRAFRRICIISVAVAEPPAAHKCQFGGFSRASRQTIQRKVCSKCSKSFITRENSLTVGYLSPNDFEQLY